MKVRAICVLAGLTAAAGMVGVSAAAAAKAAPTITCKLRLYNQSGNKPSGFDLGFVHCPKPAGHGLQRDRYTVTVKGKTATISGTYKQFFNEGTLHGTFTVTAKKGSRKETGTATITGGTGRFSHSHGTATLSCIAKSRRKTTCTETITPTHP